MKRVRILDEVDGIAVIDHERNLRPGGDVLDWYRLANGCQCLFCNGYFVDVVTERPAYFTP